MKYEVRPLEDSQQWSAADQFLLSKHIHNTSFYPEENSRASVEIAKSSIKDYSPNRPNAWSTERKG